MAKRKFPLANHAFTVIRKWQHEELEVLLLKLAPSGSKPTMFVIIGRTDPDDEYDQNGNLEESYITCSKRFDKTLEQVKKTFKIKG